MSDIIKILPDHVANQIAAGEVIQRPSSAVKELLENAVDAESTEISLIVKDAGRTLIQVIDNGKGMSETDARMCFERHATSKIQSADDLFALNTKGFRGEALASIAAIARVEMKTKRENDETGTEIIIEGTQVLTHEMCSYVKGTSISIRNLFFNVPARRNFLKSNHVELSHIIEEFQRVALAHPEVAFKMFSQDKELFQLSKGNLRQRIMGIFGNNYNEKLVPVEENTAIVNVKGFVGKAENAKKTRGEQYFFINNRFIKSNYLNHAVTSAFDGLIASDSYPSYFLFLEVDPATIDINIHPTKTEVKIEDEKSVYTIIRSAVKLSLGKYNITPSIDFDQEQIFNIAPLPAHSTVSMPQVKFNPHYNPFTNPTGINKTPANNQSWEKLYDFHLSEKHEVQIEAEPGTVQQNIFEKDEEKFSGSNVSVIRIQENYLASPVKSGLMIINIREAIERIEFDRLMSLAGAEKRASQQLLFPVTIELNNTESEILKEIIDDLNDLGYDLCDFGGNSVVMNAVPSGCELNHTEDILSLIEFYKTSFQNVKTEKKELVARGLAKRMARRPSSFLSNDEMKNLIERLFATSNPNHSPSGGKIVKIASIEDLMK